MMKCIEGDEKADHTINTEDQKGEGERERIVVAVGAMGLKMTER